MIEIKTGLKDKKILLATLDSSFLDNQYVFPHLGILYLVSVATSVGMKPKFIDNNNRLTSDLLSRYDIFYTDEFNVEDIEQYRGIDVVGISFTTSQSRLAHHICLALKTKYPQMKIILGGPHVSFYSEECQKEPVDILISGEGERIFKALLLGDAKSLSKFMLPSSTERQLIFHDFLSELEMNDFPVPYRKKNFIDKYNYSLNGIKTTTLINSRGCPMGCMFCEHRRTLGRWYSPIHFEKEIKDIVKMGIQGIMIFDDLFAMNPVKIKPYVKILKHFHKESSLIYRCFGHAKIMAKHPELLDMLSDSGCVEIGFGAESASQEILNVVRKGTTVEQMHVFVNSAIQKKIKVKAFFIIGLPGETRETFQETYEFIYKYRDKYPEYFDFDLTVLFPYKGTIIGDAIRLADGDTLFFDKQEVNRTFFGIRSREGLNWAAIDAGNYGAYKKQGGASDIVIETYDWEKDKVLLSAEDIYELKEKTMLLSGRYMDGKCHRLSTVIEGNIGVERD